MRMIRVLCMTVSAAGLMLAALMTPALASEQPLLSGEPDVTEGAPRAVDENGFPAAQSALQSSLAAKRLLIDVAKAGDRLVAVGDFGHVVLSDDGGRSWRQAQEVPTRVLLTAVAFVDARLGWAVGHDAIILHTEDGGETWVRQYSDTQTGDPLLTLHFIDANRGFAMGAFSQILATEDGGQTWVQRTLEAENDEGLEYHLNGLFTDNRGGLFVAAEFGTVYRSLNGGASFEAIETGYEGSFWGGIALEDGTLLIYGMRGNVWRSQDRGTSWSRVPVPAAQSIAGAAVLSNGEIVMAGLSGLVIRSTDGGRSFTGSFRPDRVNLTYPIDGADGLLFLSEEGVITEDSVNGSD